MKLDEGVRAVDDVDELASEFVPALAANADNEKMEGVDDPGFSNVPRREAVDVVGVPASEFFVEETDAFPVDAPADSMSASVGADDTAHVHVPTATQSACVSVDSSATSCVANDTPYIFASAVFSQTLNAATSSRRAAWINYAKTVPRSLQHLHIHHAPEAQIAPSP
ncbi:hypothetical protein HYPSUDRAFT_207817 [Hypholoma sublateritium FD-334 SS-4]|uniref:Uncharacterized protein n=1 Tax=Hypholoma sublateritium (strain FD-334 SS-4) TaxID=945553 RepID=A0A0D2P4T9_HYPSF|nr:hypothetical protein HYPSUDRAFT_207817 [Hypholoma sublateritium FD-334 SS-4]